MISRFVCLFVELINFSLVLFLFLIHSVLVIFWLSFENFNFSLNTVVFYSKKLLISVAGVTRLIKI